jgi:hypothetical protein
MTEEAKAALLKRHLDAATALGLDNIPKEAVENLHNDIMPIFDEDMVGAIAILQALMRYCKLHEKGLMRETLMQYADLAKKVVSVLSKKKDEQADEMEDRRKLAIDESNRLLELAGHSKSEFKLE